MTRSPTLACMSAHCNQHQISCMGGRRNCTYCCTAVWPTRCSFSPQASCRDILSSGRAVAFAHATTRGQIDLGGIEPLSLAVVSGPPSSGDRDAPDGAHQQQHGRAPSSAGEHGGLGVGAESQFDELPGALELDIVLATRWRFEQRGDALLAHARATRSQKLLQEKNKALETSLQEC